MPPLACAFSCAIQQQLAYPADSWTLKPQYNLCCDCLGHAESDVRGADFCAVWSRRIPSLHFSNLSALGTMTLLGRLDQACGTALAAADLFSCSAATLICSLVPHFCPCVLGLAGLTDRHPLLLVAVLSCGASTVGRQRSAQENFSSQTFTQVSCTLLSVATGWADPFWCTRTHLAGCANPCCPVAVID